MMFRTRPLSDFATFSSGGTPAKGNAKYWNGAIPWLTPKDMSSFDGTTQDSVTEAAIGNGTRLAPQNSLFIAVRGMSLHNEIRVIRPRMQMSFNQDIKSITPKPIVDERFLYFAIQAKVSDLLAAVESAGHGTGRLPTDKLQGLQIPDVSLSEQRAIAETLGALDDKIELNRRMNETLEAMARAIFKDWFVDFGPTRTKMEGRAPYLAPDIWSLFPDRLDDEGKPEGWELGSLKAFAKLNPESWSRADYPDQINYIDLSNTKWGSVEDIAHYSDKSAPSRAQRILRPGDTVVGTVRPGNGSYAIISEDGLTGSTGFAVLRPMKSSFREFVYCVATSHENIDRLAHLADGGAYPAVRPELVIDTELVSPPEEVVNEFSMATSALIDRMEANKREATTLAATRDFLLPKLMSGEIRVKDAQKCVGEVA